MAIPSLSPWLVVVADAVTGQVDVMLADSGGYSTRMRIGFSTPDKRARIAVVGPTLPVLVNPSAQDQIAIDTTRLG